MKLAGRLALTGRVLAHAVWPHRHTYLDRSGVGKVDYCPLVGAAIFHPELDGANGLWLPTYDHVKLVVAAPGPCEAVTAVRALTASLS